LKIVIYIYIYFIINNYFYCEKIYLNFYIFILLGYFSKMGKSTDGKSNSIFFSSYIGNEEIIIKNSIFENINIKTPLPLIDTENIKLE